MDGEEQARQQGGPARHPAATKADKQSGHGCMEQQVGEVALGGRFSGRGEQPVQAEGEGGQGSVGLVGPGVGQGHTPVVQLKQGGQGRRANHTGVRQDGLPEK